MGLLVLLGAAICADREQAQAADLGIDPIAQQMPEWCWAAASEMVLSHYGFPNLNPGGNYQCGVVGAQGGPCWANCAWCLNGGGTTQRIAAIIQLYAQLADNMNGFTTDSFIPRTRGIMSPKQIIASIYDDAPIIAGITPNSVPFPPGMGFSQHAVVIVGCEGDENSLDLIINDPYPYPLPSIPYVQAGGQMLQPGQYQVSYRTFVRTFHYGNSITFN
ncbi:MAG: hypothetical protein HYR63_29035 [Proteobacteria bacterium]|nr:hypothetical protein [Pseudomonadota bacterium]MBI3495767.1 hypothetical protein [Pseudomonadota bacterium]